MKTVQVNVPEGEVVRLVFNANVHQAYYVWDKDGWWNVSHIDPDDDTFWESDDEIDARVRDWPQ
jgi:hypothetical protein